MDTLIQDLRYAVRQLFRTPGFTLVAVVTLALGVGANTAVFSLANWVLLRPVPGIADDRGLVTVALLAGSGGPRRVAGPSNASSAVFLLPATLNTLRERVTAFSGIVGQSNAPQLILSVGTQALTRVSADFVSSNYFDVLRVPVGPGRPLTAADAQDSRVVVISRRLWRDRFGSDPNVVGRTLQLSGTTVTVVGVAPEGFQGTDRVRESDLWLPHEAMVTVVRIQGAAGMLLRPGDLAVSGFFGRLAEGVTPAMAVDQIRTVTSQLSEASEISTSLIQGATPVVQRGVGAQVEQRAQIATTLKVLGGIAGILLLISIANVGNLMLFRAVRRRQERAVRVSLGAGRWRLVRQAVFEGTVLALVASVAALMLAGGVTGIFTGLTVSGLPPIENIRLDWRVIAYGIGLSLVVGVVVGIIPELIGRSRALADVLKSSAARGSGRLGYARSAMGILQLSASLALCVTALLLIGTLKNLHETDLGFERKDLYVAGLDPALAGYSLEVGQNLFREIVPRVRATPGVSNATIAFTAPFVGGALITRVALDPAALDRPFSPGPSNDLFTAVSAWVAPNYFTTMGTRLVRGRDFTEADGRVELGASGGVAIVSEGLARQLFGDRDAIGETFVNQIRRDGGPRSQQYRVIGVVADSRWLSVVRREPGRMLYRPLSDPSLPGNSTATLIVRSPQKAAQVTAAITTAVSRLTPGLPVTVATMTQRIDRQLGEQRLFATVISLLTVLAVALAGVGLYGLIAFSVAERRREFGIRIALGAQGREILNYVAIQGATLAGVGTVLGLAGAFALSRVIASRLFGVTPLEPHVYIMATSFMILLALVASLVPARAATMVDPMVALRSE